MGTTDAQASDGQGTDGRNETPTERLDRNWTDLLQELRVIQTGVQLLTGFLLTLPFQQRFTRLTTGEKGVYLGTAAASIAATLFLQAPVIVHRALFRRHQRAETVQLAHRLAIVGVALLAVAVVGVSCLLTAAVSHLAVGVAAAGGVLVAIVVLWVALPLHAKGLRGRNE